MLLQSPEEKRYRFIKNVSFISTVFNEEKTIAGFLKSFFEQGYLPEEMIFVDGGSKDRTADILRDFFLNKIKSDFGLKSSENSNDNFKLNTESSVKLINSFEVKFCGENNENSFKLSVKLLQKNNTGISEGRNIAIRNANCEIICASDAGCVLDKNWVYEITKFILSNIKAENNENTAMVYDVAGGYSRPIAISFMEKILSMCIMPQLKEIKPEKFMPSSRNISFRKSAWEKAGCYPENLDYGEDMKFNFNLKNEGYNIRFNPDAVVFWRMRENIVLVFKQFFRYAKGDAKGGMYPCRHLIRFLSVFDFAVVLAISIIFSPWFLLLYVPFFAAYVFKPFSRVNITFKHQKNSIDRFFVKIAALFFAPAMLIYIDIAKMAGYIFGLVKR